MTRKVQLFIIFSFFLGIPTVFAFYFFGFTYPLNDYEKTSSDNKSHSYNWYVVQGLGESKYAPGHLGEDWSLKKASYVTDSDIQENIVYPAADGVIYKIARWPECSSCREKTAKEKKSGCAINCTMEDGSVGCVESNHGWGPVVIIKHEIPSEEKEAFDSGGSILLGDLEKKIDPSPTIKNPKVVYTLYAHLKDIPQNRKEGELVYAGKTALGKIGSICEKYPSIKKYTPLHLHFEIKDQNSLDKEIIIADIPGIGAGYSSKDGYAPNRYIPSKFIESNKKTLGEPPQKSLIQQIQDLPKDIAESVTNLLKTTGQGISSWTEEQTKKFQLAVEKAIEDWTIKQMETFQQEMQRQCAIKSAYGTEDNPQLTLFRQFRDKVLMGSETGRRFVHSYYHRISPPIVRYISRHPFAREAAKSSFDSIAKVLEVSQTVWNI